MAVLVAIGVLLVPGMTMAGGVRMKSPLTATSADSNARGQAGLGIRGADGVFDVKASRLDRSTSYDVVVGGVKVGALHTTRGGSAHLRFRSRPGTNDLVLGFDPRGKRMTIRNATGHDVLVGSMADDGTDPTATACCVPDGEDAVECEDLTADACTAAGGTPTQAASCMPDPCTTTPPPVATVCCTNETEDDGSETECDDSSAAECTAEGGTVVEAASCDANPCAPAPPPAGDVVACCVPDDDGTSAECEERTSEACAAENGTAMTGVTCDADPCAAGSGNDGESGDDGGDTGGEDGGAND